MNFVRRALAPREVKAALGVLDEAECRFQNEAFQMIKKMIEKALLKRPADFLRVIQESGGRTPREWVYSEIGNVAGDLLETDRKSTRLNSSH